MKKISVTAFSAMLCVVSMAQGGVSVELAPQPYYGRVAQEVVKRLERKHVLRKRFDDDTIAKLLEIQWWNWDEDKLHKYGAYFNDPQQLFAKLDEDK